MCRKLWPVYSCGHEQIPAQSTRTESCGNSCPEHSWGSGYYQLPTDCGNVRCSTAIRNMLDKGQVKMADWKWNYGAHAGSNNYSSGGGGSSSGMGYYGGGAGGGGDTTSYGGYGGGYGGGYAGFSPMPPPSGPSVSCPVHGGYDPAPLPAPFLQPYHNTGSGYYYQGYNSNPVLRPMSAPPVPFLGQPFFPPFPPYGGGSQGCPPPTVVVRYRR